MFDITVFTLDVNISSKSHQNWLQTLSNLNLKCETSAILMEEPAYW